MAQGTITLVIAEYKGTVVEVTVSGDVGGNLRHPGLLEGELDKVWNRAVERAIAAVRS